MHPLAPKEIQASFDEFLKKFSSAAGASAVSSGSSAGAIPLYKESSKPSDYEDWNAPSYLWQQREFSEAEIDAIMVSKNLPALLVLEGSSEEWTQLTDSLEARPTSPTALRFVCYYYRCSLCSSMCKWWRLHCCATYCPKPILLLYLRAHTDECA